ncbi:MAG: hypothetical protein WCI64_02320 [Chlorobium sp.]
MLKFILFFLVLFLVIRLALRLLIRLVKGGIFFMSRGGFDASGASSAPHVSKSSLDEAEYEVIESHLRDNKEVKGGEAV